MWKRKFWFLCKPEDDDGTSNGGGNSTSFVAETPVVSTPAEDPIESDVNWAAVADEFTTEDEGGIVEGDVQVVEETPEPKVEPAAKPKAKAKLENAEPVVSTEPPVPQAPPVAPTPVTPAPAVVAPAPAPAQAPAASPADYATWREGRVAELETQYAIDPDSANALLTEPETILPKLAAKVHMEVLESSMRAMQAMMPVMMQQITANTERNNSAKSLFTSVNPDLVDPQYEPAIMQLGQVFRNVNPTATPDEAARAIGALVRSALGIAPGVAVQPQAPAPAYVPPTPFTPSRGGPGGRNVGSDNIFTTLAEEFLREE